MLRKLCLIVSLKGDSGRGHLADIWLMRATLCAAGNREAGRLPWRPFSQNEPESEPCSRGNEAGPVPERSACLHMCVNTTEGVPVAPLGWEKLGLDFSRRTVKAHLARRPADGENDHRTITHTFMDDSNIQWCPALMQEGAGIFLHL